MTSVSRWWDWALLGFILLLASYLLLVPPVVGVADQGDYSRITRRLGLAPPAGLPFQDAYSCWLLLPWTPVAGLPDRLFSSGEIPVQIAVFLHRLTGSATMDIRFAAVVYLAMLAALVWFILREARKLPVAVYFAIAAGLALICTNSEYLAYFNSFYGEAPSLLGVIAFAAAALSAAVADRPSWPHLAGLVLASGFFAGSKAQNAPLGLLSVPLLVWIFWNQPARYRHASIAFGLVLAAWSAFILSIAPTPEVNLFNAIYDRVLPNSDSPQASLNDLGIPAETVPWMGKLYWEVQIPSPNVYPAKVTRGKLAKFYLTHPLVDLRMAQTALSFTNDVPYLGSYTKDTGAPCTARTNAFVALDRFRMTLASVWFLFPMLAGNVAAFFLWRNRFMALLATLALMAFAAFLIASFFDSEPRKHLFTFNLLFDVLFFADLAAGAARLSRMRIRMPLLRAGKTLAALVVLTAAGAYIWSGVAAKEPEIDLANLAFHRHATQSSVLPSFAFATAALAVDGKLDGDFFHHSVSSTTQETDPWWQVDLGSSRAIGSIAIANRTDCCGSRLSDYWVFLSNTPFGPSDKIADLKGQPGLWKSHQTHAPDPVSAIGTPGAKARYVRVQLEGTGYLSLAEVIVSAFGPNLALGKPASQSSSLPNYPSGPDLAVDGNNDGNFMQGSVSSTALDPQPWWQVDLGTAQAIHSVVIWNRTDCCRTRLDDFWVFISEAPFGEHEIPTYLQNRPGTWRMHVTDVPNPSMTIPTDDFKGRYVRVQLSGGNYLSLAEVQVFGK